MVPLLNMPMKFQSLFYWKLLWKNMKAGQVGFFTFQVSILVLLEIALEDLRFEIYLRDETSFNPCSIGNCSGRLIRPNRPRMLPASFNPCSIGNCSGSLKRNLRTLNLKRVSILVLLEIALEANIHPQPIPSFHQFQSLFYWKLLWKRSDFAHLCDYLFVSILVLLEIALEDEVGKLRDYLNEYRFNPCSIGNCSGSTYLGSLERVLFMFQSLFYWKLLWKNSLCLIHFHFGMCFNPCSIGNCSGRLVV